MGGSATGRRQPWITSDAIPPVRPTPARHADAIMVGTARRARRSRAFLPLPASRAARRPRRPRPARPPESDEPARHRRAAAARPCRQGWRHALPHLTRLAAQGITRLPSRRARLATSFSTRLDDRSTTFRTLPIAATVVPRSRAGSSITWSRPADGASHTRRSVRTGSAS
jgi:hypothetical protein